MNNEQQVPDIDAIVGSFVEQLRSGQNPSIADYKRRYPELAAEIDELFPVLAELENCQDASEQDSASRTPDRFSVPEKLGDYIVLKEIGRGGMGIVYEAEHETMHRRVALKVLPAQNGKNQDNLQRFMREARAAGRLHHTNIVPVFEVGHSDGVHFYAMQYIHGQNLDVVIQELKYFERHGHPTRRAPVDRTQVGRTMAYESLTGQAQSDRADSLDRGQGVSTRHGATIVDDTVESLHSVDQGSSRPDPLSYSSSAGNWSQMGAASDSYFRRVALVGVQVAEAMAYAHSHGVLHRDIKPSNLILDSEGIVWVTDFGLAKHDGDNLTHTGNLVGTLRYMAPERFEREADVRSDVYSLGLTLYELSTLQNAFDQSEHGRLVKQITTFDPPAPRSIRPEIPRDLETVILKAISREPASRYQTARQLAADLNRFVSDRPVHARRISLAERAWRWARRHPARAALAACVAIIGLMIVAGSLYFGDLNRRHAADLQIENQRARDAEKEARLAEREARAAEKEARDAEQKALVSQRMSEGHLYGTYIQRAKAERWSGRPGQNSESLKSLTSAAELLPTFNFQGHTRSIQLYNLRTHAIAAMSLWDIEIENAPAAPAHTPTIGETTPRRDALTWTVDEGWTSHVAFDFANSRYAQSDLKGKIAIRSFDNAESPVTLPSPSGEQAWVLHFSPNGNYLGGKYHHASTPNKPTFCLWDLTTEQPVLQLEEGLRSAWYCFSSDSQHLAIGTAAGQAKIYSTASGALEQTLELGAEPRLMHFAHDDSQLIFVAQPNNTVQFWSLAEESRLRTVSLTKEITCLNWRDESRQLAAASDNRVYVWPANHLDVEPLQLDGHKSRIVRLALDPQRRVLMTYSWDGTARLFDLVMESQVLRIDGLMLTHQGFDQLGGRIGFTSESSEFGVWKLPTRPFKVVKIPDKTAGSRPVLHPVHSRLVGYITSEGVGIWDHEQNQTVFEMACGRTTDLCFGDDGTSLYTCGEGGVRKWSLELLQLSTDRFQISSAESETILAATPSTPGANLALDVCEQHDLACVRLNTSQALLINMKDDSTVEIGPHPGMSRPKISSCGRFVFTDTWKGFGVKVWDTRTGAEVTHLVPDWESAAVACSPDGQQLIVVSGAKRWMWNLGSSGIESQTQEFVWEPVSKQDRVVPDGWPGGLSYSRDSLLLATVWSRYEAQLIDPKTGWTLAAFQPPDQLMVASLQFSGDGHYLCVTDRQIIHLWDLRTIRQRLAEMGIDWDQPEIPLSAAESGANAD